MATRDMGKHLPRESLGMARHAREVVTKDEILGIQGNCLVTEGAWWRVAPGSGGGLDGQKMIT